MFNRLLNNEEKQKIIWKVYWANEFPLTIVFKTELWERNWDKTLLVADSPLSEGDSSLLAYDDDLRIPDSKPDALPTE